MVAHRGLSAIETENTAAAFVAAGNRGYWGSETDIYRTSDGHFICSHDSTTGRVCGEELTIEQTDFDTLRALVLHDHDGVRRGDLRLCTPEEYLSICRCYGMVCVVELKSEFTDDEIARIIDIFSGYLDKTIFISFSEANLDRVKAALPNQRCQWLTWNWTDELPAHLAAKGIGLDIAANCLSEERYKALREHGVEINTWTVDDPAEAARLVSLGVDQITTNILR